MVSEDKKRAKIAQIMASAPLRYRLDDYFALGLKQFEQLVPDFVPELIKEDIVLYFHYLRSNRSKKSLKQWESTSGCTDSPNSWKAENYRPIFG